MMSGKPIRHNIGRMARFYGVLLAGALACWLVGALSIRRDTAIHGGCAQESSATLSHVRNRAARAITYCEGGDAYTGSLRTNDLPVGTARIDIETAGYIGAPDQELSLVGGKGERVVEQVTSSGEHWEQTTIFVPKVLREQAFHLELNDKSSGIRGWSGLAIVGYSKLHMDPRVLAGALTGLALLHFFMLELGLLVSRFGEPAHAAHFSLIALGLLSCAAFWAYYIAHWLGAATTAAIAVVLVAHAVWRAVARSSDMDDRAAELHDLFAPVAASTLLLFILAFYPFPAYWETWQFAASRWMALPIDNWLPKVFADQVWKSAISRPMLGDWLSSDRPPLQAGFALLLHLPLYREGWYQLASMWLQMTCLVPAALIIPMLGLGRVRALVLLLVATSALALYNGVFVWPKLIAATYCLVFYLCMLSEERESFSLLSRMILAGASASLAMLAHGGALFALAGIALIALLQKAERKWPFFLGAGLIALAVYAPWVIYQRFIDPPGTRLLAWHLAGVEAVSAAPVGTVIRNAYAQLTLAQWLEGRWINIRTLFAELPNFCTSVLHALLGETDTAASMAVRGYSFRYFAYSLWFFQPVLWLLMLRRTACPSPPTDREIRAQMLAIAVGLGIWSLLIFTPGQTIIHQGSYSLNLMTILVTIAVTYRFSPALFHALATLNLLVCVRVFLPAPHVQPRDFQAIFTPAAGDDSVYLLALAVCAAGLYLVCRAAGNAPSASLPPA